MIERSSRGKSEPTNPEGGLYRTFPRLLMESAAILAAVAGTAHLVRRRRVRPTFHGRTVLITGGARGLGLALARRFARERARLVLAGRDPAALDRARHELAAAGADVLAVRCDVRDDGDVANLVQQTVSRTGRIDVVVNNAGVIQMTPFRLATAQDFADSLATHFWGPLHVTRAALPHLVASRGRIVNISSIGGRIAVPHLVPYCVGKFALAALSDGLHAELAPEGVSVLTVTPGLMRTGSHRNVRVRGRHAAEATWFALASATPLTSMAVDRAARHIVAACRARRARLTVGVQARAAEVASVLSPEIAAGVSALVARWLPRERGQVASPARWSRDLDLGRVTALFPRRAARRMNQPIALDEL